MIALNRMNRKAELRPANLFFVELLIVLLFFSLSAAIILQVFAIADNKQKLGELTERSIIQAQSIAECYSVNGSIPDTLQQLYGVTSVDSEAATLALDNSFAVSLEGTVALSLTRISNQQTEAGELTQLRIEFSFAENQLYSLVCSSYIPKGGAVDE